MNNQIQTIAAAIAAEPVKTDHLVIANGALLTLISALKSHVSAVQNYAAGLEAKIKSSGTGVEAVTKALETAQAALANPIITA